MVLTSTLSCQRQGNRYVASPFLCTSSPSFTMRIPARKRVHVRSIQPHASNRTPANFGARLPPPVGRHVSIEQHSYPGPPLFPIRRGSCSTGCGRLRGGVYVAVPSRLLASRRIID